MGRKRPPCLRFFEKIDQTNSGCWNWTGSRSGKGKGYGQIKVFGKMVSAHRYSYEIHNGPISDGMCVLHTCDNKQCVNPDHLRLGTHAENMKEAAERGLMPSGPSSPRWGVKTPRPKQANKVIVLGGYYESQKSAERALGLGGGTVRYWIKSKPHKAFLAKD